MMPSRMPGLRARAARRTARLQLGPLKDQLIAPKTQMRYSLALSRFFHFLRQHSMPMPRTAVRLDSALSKFIDNLWESGDPLGYAQDAISGVQHHVPRLRRQLQGSWRLIAAWRKAEIPARADPFLPSFAIAAAAYPEFSVSEALAILLSYHCMLRTGEMLDLQWKHIQAGTKVGLVSLQSTKSGNRYNFAESVPVSDPMLLSTIANFKARARPDSFLIARTEASFRALFRKAVNFARLPRGNWKPYSLRRGGATQHFREHGSMDATCIRGRWANVRTCRIYVNNANAAASEMSTSRQQEGWHSDLRKALVERLRQTGRVGKRRREVERPL